MSRLRRSDQIIGGSAIALFIFMFFFKWLGFSSNVPVGGGSYSSNGWNSFHNSRWIWIITIIVALGTVAISAGVAKLESPVQPGVLVAGLGALSTALILYRILKHPSASSNFGSFHASYGIKIGIWLGLVAAAGITYGGYLGMQAEGTSLSDVRDQASGAISNLSSSSPSSPAPPSRPSEAAGPPAPPIPPPAPPIPPPASPPSSGSEPGAPPEA